MMFCLHTAGIVLFIAVPAVGEVFHPAVLAVWLVIRFFCPWAFTLFGASAAKVKGYNESFKNTLRVIPKSDTHVIPDLYHMILHTLILLSLVLTLCAVRGVLQ